MATKPKSKKKSSGKSAVSTGGKTRTSVQDAARDGAQSLDAAASAALAAKEAVAGTRAAGKAVSAAASGARLPLIAGGSLVAGLSGGLALIKRRQASRRRSRSLGFGGAMGAVQQVGSFGEEMARISRAVQDAGDRGGSRR